MIIINEVSYKTYYKLRHETKFAFIQSKSEWLSLRVSSYLLLVSSVTTLYTLRLYEQYNEEEGAYYKYNNQRNETESVDYSSCQHPVSSRLRISVRLLSIFIVNWDLRFQQIQYTFYSRIVWNALFISVLTAMIAVSVTIIFRTTVSTPSINVRWMNERWLCRRFKCQQRS